MQQLRRLVSRYPRPLLFIGIFAVFFLWSYVNLDPDFGWHLRSGQYFIGHGIPKYDIFTYTASSFHWVNHEWLSDVIVASVFSIGSYWLLSLLYAAMWTTTVAIVGRGVHWALIISAVVAILPFAGVRALTWSVLALALLVLLLQQKDKRWRLGIPLLFLVWANVHGSFLIGIAYGGWQLLRERSWRLAVIGIVSAGLTLVNPYGVEIYTEIFRTMFDGDLHARIQEWARFALPLSTLPYILTWLGLTVYYYRCKWRQYIRFENLLFIMSVTSMRMTPLFVLMSLQGLQQTIKAIDLALPKKFQTERRRIAKIAGVVLVIVSLLTPVIESAISRSGLDLNYPSAAVTYLRDNPCDGNLFNSYNYGGFLIWQLPDHKVYIDGRMPSWGYEGGMYMTNYLRVIDEKAFRDDEFERYDIRCVLAENESPVTKALKAEGWNPVVNDNTSSLLLIPKS